MYYHEKSWSYYDGKWCKPEDSVTGLYSQTLHYGNGVFEGIRSYETASGAQIYKAKEHFERLLYSCQTMGIELNMTASEMERLAYELLERNQLKDAYIRPLVFLGEQMSLQTPDEVHFFMCAWEWGKYLGSDLLRVMSSSFQRPNPKSCFVEAKVCGHYTNSILATMEAKKKGYHEALLFDANGNVAEGPGANFFYQKGEQLFTCPPGNILKGITRQSIFELSEQLGIPLEEKHSSLEDLLSADSAFFTGTAAEVAGISSLNDYRFPLDWEKSLGCQLAKAYAKEVRKPVFKKQTESL